MFLKCWQFGLSLGTSPWHSVGPWKYTVSINKSSISSKSCKWCYSLNFFLYFDRISYGVQLSPSNSESSFNSLEDFSTTPNTCNHEDSDTGMVGHQGEPTTTHNALVRVGHLPVVSLLESRPLNDILSLEGCRCGGWRCGVECVGRERRERL